MIIPVAEMYHFDCLVIVKYTKRSISDSSQHSTYYSHIIVQLIHDVVSIEIILFNSLLNILCSVAIKQPNQLQIVLI